MSDIIYYTCEPRHFNRVDRINGFYINKGLIKVGLITIPSCMVNQTEAGHTQASEDRPHLPARCRRAAGKVRARYGLGAGKMPAMCGLCAG